MTKGFIRNKKFHPIRNRKHVIRKQIGIVTGGVALGTKAVAKGAFEGSGSVAKKGITAIGTPSPHGTGSKIISSLGAGTKKGLKIGGEALKQELREQIATCRPLSVNPRTGEVGGINLRGGSVKVDSCMLKAVAQSKTTDVDRISSGLFGNSFNSLPEDRKAVVLFMQQGNAKR